MSERKSRIDYTDPISIQRANTRALDPSPTKTVHTQAIRVTPSENKSTKALTDEKKTKVLPIEKAKTAFGVLGIGVLAYLAIILPKPDDHTSTTVKPSQPEQTPTALTANIPESTSVPVVSEYQSIFNSLPEQLKEQYLSLETNVQWTDVGGYSVLKPPVGMTIDGQGLQQIFTEYHSPAANDPDFGEKVFRRAARYPIDTAIIPAFAQEENGMGSKSNLPESAHNLWDIRYRDKTDEDKAWDVKYGYELNWEKIDLDGNGSFKSYKSYDDAVEDFLRTLTEVYVNDDRTTLDGDQGIIAKYAPGADNNNENMYFKNVKDLTEKFRFEKGIYKNEDFSQIYADGPIFGPGSQDEITQGQYGTFTHNHTDWLGRYFGGTDFIKTDKNGNNISEGAEIYAPASGIFYYVYDNPDDGTGVSTDKNRGMGNNEIIEGYDKSNGDVLITRMAHVKKIKVGLKNGQWVDKGWVIGYAGNTGISSESHVHVNTYINDKSLDSTQPPFGVK